MEFKSCIFLLGLFIAFLNAQQEEIAGSTVTLACPLQGSFTYPTWSGPPGSTGYIREGQETSPNYPWVAYAENKKDLVISDVKPEYSGDYICEKDEFGSSIISLSVIAKPDVLLADKTVTKPGSSFVRHNIITGFEDKNLTVSCTATGGRPEPQLLIFVNNTAIEDIDFLNERVETKKGEPDTTATVTLLRTFTAKRKYDMTEISCKATNSNPGNKLGSYVVADTSTIYLSLKPLTHVYTGGGTAKVGESRNFSCEAHMGRPAPTLSWLYDGQPASADKFTKYPMKYLPLQEDETVTAGQTLSLKNASREDNKKEVVVIISHEALDVPYTGSMEIMVDFGPAYVNISGNKPVYADDGATLTLTCTTALVSYPSNYTIRWMNDTTTKEQWYKRRFNRTDMWVKTPGDYNAFIVSENITLAVDRYMDGQSVSCESSPAEFWTTTILDSVVLDIKYPPIITEPHSPQMRVAEHEEVSLLCTAWSKPPSKFSWYKAGSNIPLAEGNGTIERNAFAFSISSVTRSSDAAIYRCVATNKEGLTVEKEIELIVSDGPAVPFIGYIRPSTDSLTIPYSSGSSSRPILLENYYLQYRLAGKSSTTWHEVLLPSPSQESTDFKLSHLKPGTEIELRIKVTNRDGSRYTAIVETKTHEASKDDITQKDVNIAIIVSVIVTAVVVLAVVGIIFYCYRRKQSFDPSRKFEMETSSPLRT